MAGRIKMALMVLALVGANGSWTSDAPTLKGRVLGGDGTGGVWLGVVGGDPEAANWTLIEGEYFEVPAPPGERARLVAMAKDRVPLVVSLPAGEQRRHVELRLAQGLALEGTARSDDGNLLRGAAIRISRGNAIVPDVLGIAVPLKKAKIEVVLADGSRVEVPPFARPRWETNRHGAFRIGGLETGRHFLEATAEGYVPALLKDVTVREGAVNAAELVLFKGFLVVGQVVDGDGAPVAGAEVRADWLQPTAEPHRDWGELVHREVRRHTTGRTGDDGSFRLGPFEAGPKVEVFATSPELGSSKRLEVFAPYDGLVLALRRDVVRGRVVDAATGEPVESFELRLVTPTAISKCRWTLTRTHFTLKRRGALPGSQDSSPAREAYTTLEKSLSNASDRSPAESATPSPASRSQARRCAVRGSTTTTRPCGCLRPTGSVHTVRKRVPTAHSCLATCQRTRIALRWSGLGISPGSSGSSICRGMSPTSRSRWHWTP